MVSGDARCATDPTSLVAEIAALSGEEPDGTMAWTTRIRTSPATFNAPTLEPPRGSSTKSSHAPRPQSVPPKRRRVQRLAVLKVRAIALVLVSQPATTCCRSKKHGAKCPGPMPRCDTTICEMVLDRHGGDSQRSLCFPGAR